MSRSKHDGQHQDRPELTQSADSATAQEPLNLGHAGLGSDCWGARSAMASAAWSCWSQPAWEAPLRLPRPARQRTPLHCLRPAQEAQGRFTSEDFEILAG
jgi:hypothetical protein